MKNLAAKGYKVSGLLLYAQTDEGTQLSQKYNMSDNWIHVQTLNLNCDFTEIQKHLDEIANQFVIT